MEKSIVLSSHTHIELNETDPVSRKEQRDIQVKYWCKDCGNQFKGSLMVIGATRESGKQELCFERCRCPKCQSLNTSPHVEQGTIIKDQLGGDPSFGHYVEAVKLALKSQKLETPVPLPKLHE